MDIERIVVARRDYAINIIATNLIIIFTSNFRILVPAILPYFDFFLVALHLNIV